LCPLPEDWPPEEIRLGLQSEAGETSIVPSRGKEEKKELGGNGKCHYYWGSKKDKLSHNILEGERKKGAPGKKEFVLNLFEGDGTTGEGHKLNLAIQGALVRSWEKKGDLGGELC